MDTSCFVCLAKFNDREYGISDCSYFYLRVGMLLT